MRVSSISAKPARRKPQQARAAERRAQFLKVAATLIGEHGYDAVSMTAIAAEAGASIGTLYDYFTDKQSIAIALLSAYSAEADAYWVEVFDKQKFATTSGFTKTFVQGVLTFVKLHPAYLPLMGAVGYVRTPDARQPLRRTISDALQKAKPELPAARAFLGAQVLVELMKGMLVVFKQVAAKDRETVISDFETLMETFVSGLG